MKSKLISILTGLLLSIHGAAQTRTARNVPNRIAFISDIGGGSSIYVIDPDHSDINRLGKLHLDDVRIPGPWGLAFSPDKTKVMFVGYSTTRKDHALWMMNTDGSGAQRLIDWKWATSSPFRAVWSPKGGRIAFVANDTTYVMNLDGSNLHFVAYGDLFSWSPDGKQLAIGGYVPKQVGRFIYVVNADGTNLRRISHSGRALQCVWSPNGRLIAFSESRPETTSESVFDVFVIQPDGRGQKTIIESVPLYSSLTWSPGGEFLSFTAKIEGKRGLYAWRAPAFSREQLRFFSDVGGTFEWSPDGKQIAYEYNGVRLLQVESGKIDILYHTSGFDSAHWFSGGQRLLLNNTRARYRTPDATDLDLWTTSLRPRFITRLTDETLHVTDISAAPTGNLIAFTARSKANDPQSEATAYVVRPDGSGLRKLPAPSIEPGWFAWSPDGSRVAFVKKRDPLHLEIRVVNADGSGEQILVESASWNFAPAWLPDGNRILFLTERANALVIYSVDVSSKRTTPVREISSGKGFLSALWSPDATKLAIVTREEGIRLINLANPFAPFRYRGISPSVLSWTPDSQQLVVTDFVHGLATNSVPPSYIDLVAADGSSRVRLIPARAQYFPRPVKFAWRLDGERFAFNGISIFDRDGSNQRKLINGFRPVWVR